MSESLAVDSSLDQARVKHFGLPSFRPLQREIIQAVLSGQPTLAVLPTGSGKSLCYQLPAVLLPGVTLVISPLISLMKDQVDVLTARGIRAVAINSHDTQLEGRDKLEALQSGQVKLAYVAPERLRNPAFLRACKGATVSLLTVDEAHCISQWGHDFRPDYLGIRDFRAELGDPTLLALTATARPEVRRDILSQLGLLQAQVFTASANRENLWLGLETCATVAEKRAKLAHLVRHSGGSTILYVSSRKDAEAWATFLETELGETALPYHAGMAPNQRAVVQNRFMAGLARVVVATNAFGMGIDKADVRAVLHAGVPESLEAYLQEAGRAGRDGQPARCTMVLVPGMDIKIREYLLQRQEVSGALFDELCRKLRRLERTGGALNLDSESYGPGTQLLSILSGMGCLEVNRGAPDSLEVQFKAPLTDEALETLRRHLRDHERVRADRFARVRNFVYLRDRCRREFLLRYFGEGLRARPHPCCSACNPEMLVGEIPVRPTATRAKRGSSAPKVPDTATAADTAGSQYAAGARRSPSATSAPAHPADPLLLQQLKEWRRLKARALAVPSYVVFGDRDLTAIAEAAPGTLTELAQCRGIGPVKLQQYGAELLDIIKQRPTALAAPGAEIIGPDAESAGPRLAATLQPPVADIRSEPRSVDVRPDPEDSGSANKEPARRRSRRELMAAAARHVLDGKSLEETAVLLERAQSTTCEYLIDWIQEDASGAWRTVARKLVSPEDFWDILTGWETSTGLKDAFDYFGGRFSYHQLRICKVVLARVLQLVPAKVSTGEEDDDARR